MATTARSSRPGGSATTASQGPCCAMLEPSAAGHGSMRARSQAHARGARERRDGASDLMEAKGGISQIMGGSRHQRKNESPNESSRPTGNQRKANRTTERERPVEAEPAGNDGRRTEARGILWEKRRSARKSRASRTSQGVSSGTSCEPLGHATAYARGATFEFKNAVRQRPPLFKCCDPWRAGPNETIVAASPPPRCEMLYAAAGRAGVTLCRCAAQ